VRDTIDKRKAEEHHRSALGMRRRDGCGGLVYVSVLTLNYILGYPDTFIPMSDKPGTGTSTHLWDAPS